MHKRSTDGQMNRRDFHQTGRRGHRACWPRPGCRRRSRLNPTWVAVGSEADFVLDQPVPVADGKAFVVRRATGLRALSALCTHRSCKVTVEGGEFICPCHMARFGLGGEVLKGPAREPLSAVPVKVEAGQVLVADLSA